MRLRSFLATAAALMAAALVSPPPAEAGWHRSVPPQGWGREQTVRHWAYYPRYSHVYLTSSTTDRYAYRYEPRGYYPYYNSGYWVPACKYCRPHYNYKLPKYYKAWGSTKRSYEHNQWHNKHHGGHRRGHW